MNESSRNIRKYPWGHERRFNSYSNYFRKIYGGRVQKVSVDAGFTCPNRDGTKGRGGCTYCNNDAFSPSYCKPSKSVSLQLSEGISFHKWRYKRASSYLAYFQAFSNTYAPVEVLERLYTEALSHPEVTGIIIGTRPDCIDEEKLEMLKKISAGKYIAVEYGIESCYDRTLLRINRGHTFAEALAALEMTARKGIITGAHFIFGLPGESRAEMLAGSDLISSLPVTTVKFHQLQIIKGTAMEKEFQSSPGDFSLFSWEEYLDFFISFLERLNPALVVERFTGEAPPRYLDGELWGKKRSDDIVRLFERRLEELDTWQGRLYNIKDQPE